MKIFINPGHGGTDCGACGNGLKERDVALNIGKRVEDYLRAVGYDVKFLQYDDLQGICDSANSWQADLFVSIHCNTFDGRAHGTETYRYYGSTAGRKLADVIHEQITSSLPLFDKGVKEAGFYFLENTDMPAALVETAFIDNPTDAKLLVEREDDFAKAIARGVTDYLALPSPDVIDKLTRR